jgi:type III restriction enzyme
VDGYRQAIRNRVTIDWSDAPTLTIDPIKIPPEVEVKANIPSNQGRPSLSGPGKLEKVDLNPYRSSRRFQELVFDMAAELTREYVNRRECEAPAHVLFPQMRQIVDRYLREKVRPLEPAKTIDVFCSPYYGWVIERLKDAIKPDVTQGEAPIVPTYEKRRAPGSTGEVDFWTSREVREVVRSHVNYVVADTKKWEESAAYYIDTNDLVDAFVKNAGLGSPSHTSTMARRTITFPTSSSGSRSNHQCI